MLRASIAVLVLLLSATVSAEEKVRIGWVYAMANAPVVIADKQGLFAKEGVEVEITSFTSGPILHQALAAGQLDMAYIGAPPVYHWYSRGLKSQILAKVNYGQAAVIVRKDSGITSLKDLRGKKIAGVKKGSGMDVLLRGYVLGEAAGLEADKDVRVIPMPPGNMGPSVENGVVDAAFIWEPFTSQYELRGTTKVIFDMNEAVPGYPWYVVMAPPEVLKEKRAAITKVLRAHNKAIEFLNSAPDAGNDIIAEAFKMETVEGPDGKKYPGTAVVAQARKRIGWDSSIKKSDSDFIQQLMTYSYKLGYIKGELTPKQLVDASVMSDATTMEAGL
ncbi:MAG: ABC transporter substrate-binding protein [Gammaproteobacteria bacterium]|nr:ABC transporter substrate-binding protein [Gammaproteobacteria bacterium]